MKMGDDHRHHALPLHAAIAKEAEGGCDRGFDYHHQWDKKHPALPDHPNPARAIVAPQEATPLSGWEDGDLHAPAEAAKRLWLELVRRTEEAAGEANAPDAKTIKRRSR
jgi:hypothetical protein